jgi:homospermidine synthase
MKTKGGCPNLPVAFSFELFTRRAPNPFALFVKGWVARGLYVGGYHPCKMQEWGHHQFVATTNTKAGPPAHGWERTV